MEEQKEELIELIKNNRNNFSQIIRSKFSELFNFIELEYEGANFSEKLYQYINGSDCNVCERFGCENKTKFRRFFNGYNRFCSNRCSSLSSKTIFKRKRTNNIRYNDLNYNNLEKRIKTNQIKYGKKHGLQNLEVITKGKNTKLKKYGNINYNNSDLAKISLQKTLLHRYGVMNISQLPEVKAKQKNKILENMFDGLYLSNRLSNLVKPKFTKDQYVGVKKIYKFECIMCGRIFYDNLDKGRTPRCYVCFPRQTCLSGSSKMEQEIIHFIEQIYDDLILKNDRDVLNGEELDIYLPNCNLAIEFNGLYWHSELNGKDKKYHLNKTIECEKQGIHLIHIFEDEWLYKKEIVKNRLKHIFKKTDRIVYARKCILMEISAKDKNKFLTQYHIQGSDKSSIKIGAFYERELIGVMTFGKRRVSMGKKSTEKGEYELLRFTISVNSSGLASKLLQHFIRTYNPKKIVSYADRRWTFHTNNLYEKIGFKKMDNGQSNYWYIVNGQRKHRFGYRKNVLNQRLENFDPDLTEWQNMQLNGYDRIWDCGSLKYEINLC